MKNIIKATVLMILILMVFSCDLFKDEPEVLIASRMSSFEADVNAGNYNDLQKHFHPSMVGYENYADGIIIASGPLKSDNGPFVFDTPVSVESSSGYTAANNVTNGFDVEGTYAAEMREDGDDWLFYSLDITIGDEVLPIRTLK